MADDININGNNNTHVQDKGKAYMGDGMQGIGKFLTGVAAAYLKIITDDNFEEFIDVTSDTFRVLDTTENRVRNSYDLNEIEKWMDDYKRGYAYTDDHTRSKEHIDNAVSTDEEVDRIQFRLNPRQEGILCDWLTNARDKFLSQEFQKANAVKDSQGAIDSIFHDYERQYLPQIYSNQMGHGLYNDTTSQLLANDGYAAATVKAGKLQLETITEYQGIIQRFSDQVKDGLDIAIKHQLREELKTQRIEDTDRDTQKVVDQDIQVKDTVSRQVNEDQISDRHVQDIEHNDTTEREDTNVERHDHKKSERTITERRRPDLTEFAKDAAIMALFAGLLKPYINRCYTEQHDDCSDNSPDSLPDVPGA